MKKSDLIAVLAEKHILTGKQAEDIVDLVFDGFCETLKNGGRIEIRDLVLLLYGNIKLIKAGILKLGNI